jgi:hypothetical protein
MGLFGLQASFTSQRDDQFGLWPCLRQLGHLLFTAVSRIGQHLPWICFCVGLHRPQHGGELMYVGAGVDYFCGHDDVRCFIDCSLCVEAVIKAPTSAFHDS